MTIDHKVTEQRVNGKYVPVVSDAMKNKSSCRTLPLISAVEEALLKQKEKQQLYRRLTKDELDSVQWLPADRVLLERIRCEME